MRSRQKHRRAKPPPTRPTQCRRQPANPQNGSTHARLPWNTSSKILAIVAFRRSSCGGRVTMGRPGEATVSTTTTAARCKPRSTTTDSIGFRIVVTAPGGLGGNEPHPGDRPELWLGVDRTRPQVELTAAEVGRGELAGQLLLRWRVDDEHLESRPIGLFYSSRPAGPWSTIATSLENNGEYAWHVERHVPSQIYLRIEARDLAGNKAAYQTSDPVTVDLPQIADIAKMPRRDWVPRRMCRRPDCDNSSAGPLVYDCRRGKMPSRSLGLWSINVARVMNCR